MSRKIKLDKYDYSILEILQKEATISNKDLAKRIGLSPPATLVRVNQLKSKNYLLEASYTLNWTKLGFQSYIHVYCSVKREDREKFLKLLDAFPNVLESYEYRKHEEFLVDFWHYRYKLLCVCKDQYDWHKKWDEHLMSKGIIIDFQAVRVHEKRSAKLPVPFLG